MARENQSKIIILINENKHSTQKVRKSTTKESRKEELIEVKAEIKTFLNGRTNE